MLLLSDEDVRSLIDMESAVTASATAYALVARGEAVTPVRHAIALGPQNSVTLFMPGYLPKRAALGLKVGSLVPANAGKGLPSTICTILLIDPSTGEASALIEATWLTALRTGAGVGVATRAMARPDVEEATMLGAGGMAFHLIEAMLVALPCLQRMTIYNRTQKRAALLVKQAAAAFGDRCRFEVAAQAEAAVKEAGVVTVCTSSETPIIHGAWVAPGTHVNLAGAHGGTMREGDDALIQTAAIVAVDKSDAARASGEIALPLASGALDEARLREIGAILNGASAGRTAVNDITVFKSVGIAAQDLATAAMVVERAMERGKGTRFDLGLKPL